MAKSYVLGNEENFILYELEGKKKRKKPVSVRSQKEYSETILYPWFLQQICDFEWDIRNEYDILRLKEYIPERVQSIISTPYFLDKGVIYTSYSLLDMERIKEILSWYHRTMYKGTYHLLDTKQKQIIRRGQIIRKTEVCYGLSSYQESELSFLKKWDEEISCYFSQEEWEEIAWVLICCRLKGECDIPRWMENKYGERISYFPYFFKKEIEKYVYYSMIVTFQLEKNNE